MSLSVKNVRILSIVIFRGKWEVPDILHLWGS